MRNKHFHGSELTYRETADCSASVQRQTPARACALRSARCTCGTYMHLESPLYRNTIHSSSQYSKVVMHSLVLPHTLLTLHICTCAGRRCERDVRCAHSVFGLQTSMPMHAALRSTKYRASSTQAAAPARWCSLCVCTSYSATSETTTYSYN